MLSKSMAKAGRIDSSVPIPYKEDPMMSSTVHFALASRHPSWTRELVSMLSGTESGDANDLQVTLEPHDKAIAMCLEIMLSIPHIHEDERKFLYILGSDYFHTSITLQPGIILVHSRCSSLVACTH